MLKSILKRALAEAVGNRYRSGKSWKKSRYGSGWYGPGPGQGPGGYGRDPYRPEDFRHGAEPGYGGAGYGSDHGFHRSRGVRGFLIDAAIKWLMRRR